MGSHIGTDDFVKSKVTQQSKKVKKMMDKAANLSDPQCAMLLLSNCFDCCRVTYLMTTVDPDVIDEILVDFDIGLKEAVDKVMGKVQTDLEFDNFTLKVKNGGHGVRVSHPYAKAAHLGSFSESKHFICNYLSMIDMNVADDTDLFVKEDELIMRFCDKYRAG